MDFVECSDSVFVMLIRNPFVPGTGDDCSVSSDISERTGILDDESEKSHPRVSTVSVVSIINNFIRSTINV